MRYGQLGNTDMFVSKLCLGTMTVGEATNGSMWRGGGDCRVGRGRRRRDRQATRGSRH